MTIRNMARPSICLSMLATICVLAGCRASVPTHSVLLEASAIDARLPDDPQNIVTGVVKYVAQEFAFQAWRDDRVWTKKEKTELAEVENRFGDWMDRSRSSLVGPYGNWGFKWSGLDHFRDDGMQTYGKDVWTWAEQYAKKTGREGAGFIVYNPLKLRILVGRVADDNASYGQAIVDCLAAELKKAGFVEVTVTDLK